MPKHSFGLRGPHELLDKARREVEALKKASATPLAEDEVQRLADHAMNAALTIWHMTDWLASSQDARIRNALAKSALATQTAITVEATKRTSLKLCWLIAHGSTHLTLAPDRAVAQAEGVANARVSATTVYVGLGPNGELILPGARRRPRAPAPKADLSDIELLSRYRVTIPADGRDYRAVEVFEDAIRFWVEFLRDHKIQRS